MNDKDIMTRLSEISKRDRAIIILAAKHHESALNVVLHCVEKNRILDAPEIREKTEEEAEKGLDRAMQLLEKKAHPSSHETVHLESFLNLFLTVDSLFDNS